MENKPLLSADPAGESNPTSAHNKPIVAIVPPCTWPRTPTVPILLTLMALQALVCLFDAAVYPPPLSTLVAPVQHVLLYLFRTQQALRLFLSCTLLVHALEALYALSLIRRALRGHGFGGIRAVHWALQTTLVGFPSLLLLMRLLSDSPTHTATTGTTTTTITTSNKTE